MECQTTAIILIGDGEWNADTHGEAVRKIRSLNRKPMNILTYSVGYGSDVVGKADVEKDLKILQWLVEQKEQIKQGFM